MIDDSSFYENINTFLNGDSLCLIYITAKRTTIAIPKNLKTDIALYDLIS